MLLLLVKFPVLNYLIAAVWLINGLFCKVLNMVPRHTEIVARILLEQSSRYLTVFIGLGEILMACWILSKNSPRTCAIIQAILIITMNFIEIVLAHDLLLFGPWNGILAAVLVVFVLINGFSRPEGRPTNR